LSTRQGSLLSQISPETGWKAPEQLPELSRYKRIAFDSEWDGVDWHGSSMPIGWSFCTEDRKKWYLPVGHLGGGNLDRNVVKRWFEREVRNKELVTLSGKGDIQMTRKFGVDLEAQGNTIREVQHKAALLSDVRRSFKMEDMLFDFLGRHKHEIDRSKIWELPAYEVGPYAEGDAEDTLDLDDYLAKKVSEENLDNVLDLEDSLIYCVCEMERNGVPLDVNLLNDWRGKIRRRFENIIMIISEGTGLKVNPNSGADLARLFGLLNIEYPRTPGTEKFPNGQPSFTDDFLKTVNNEYSQLAREARGLDSLDSKYLLKYLKALKQGILYYQLHQLKGDEDYGTISGRFSSSNVNIQQVFDPEKQERKSGHRDYLIRYLFGPERGKRWVRADASQIEFRLFVHYSKSQRLIDIYNNNPEVDFHEQAAEMCHIGRKPAKTINFLMLYGGGKDKLAFQLGMSRTESDKLYAEYNHRFPEMRDLYDEVMGVAKRRGHVKTIMGRRARFPGGERIHSALNRVLQGTAADVLKRKLKEVYEMRHELGLKMRLTVHDELDGDIVDDEHANRLRVVLERPLEDLKIRVPLLWDVSTGSNWGETSIPSKWRKEGWVPPWQ
jgi:DNA polymerase-1